MRQIKELIDQKKWLSLVPHQSPKAICLALNFNEAMQLVKHLFFENMHDDEIQQFALKLAFEIKVHFKNEWGKDWKNDVFLGHLCSILWNYEEQYRSYKRAYDQLEDPPAELLLLLSGCNNGPGIPPISNEESEEYLKKSIQKRNTYEAAHKMSKLFEFKGNSAQAAYWEEIAKKLKNENTLTKTILPNVLNE